MADFFFFFCDGCKYEMHDGIEFPCSQCKGTTLPSSDEYKTRLDLWEPMHEQKAETETDVVNHPSHYTQGGIECIDALKAATVSKTGIEAVCTANAIKYLWRYEEKNGIEDVKKARWYIDRLIKELENG